MSQHLPQEALRQWSEILGTENVITAEASLKAAETSTFATGHTIPAILRPATREQVQECVRIAARWGAPLYPISSGKNWGYGSRAPASDGCVLMDLGRMNRILDFSEELAYVTVEPGVTQAQLYGFLRERNSKLWMDATGASPECSLIGNTVERGFGHTPYGDHFANCCGLEVVTGDGEILETGFARFPGAKAAAQYRWGVGPVLDGLFTQSNFGVVTRMTIWLMPAPEYFQAYYFKCERAERLPDLVDALRPLRLNGTIRSASHIANDYKVLQAVEQYPWAATEGRTPLLPERMPEIRRGMRIGAWNGSGALYGTRAQVKEARRLLRGALKGIVTDLQFLDDRKLALASRFAKVYEKVSGWNLSRTLAVLRPVYGLMKGIPTDQPLFSTYWRKPSTPPEVMDPDRDGCGLLWCSPVTPNDGNLVRELTVMASELMLRHGFEPAISLTVITERAISCIISLTYDRAVPGEDARALACYHEMLGVLSNAGFRSYRLSVAGMSAISHDSYAEFLGRLKRLLDPREIISPGRYVPVQASPDAAGPLPNNTSRL